MPVPAVMVFAVMMLAAFPMPAFAVMMFVAVLGATAFAALCLGRGFPSGVGLAARTARSAEITVAIAAGAFFHFFRHICNCSFQNYSLA